jgi:hypothetical protein
MTHSSLLKISGRFGETCRLNFPLSNQIKQETSLKQIASRGLCFMVVSSLACSLILVMQATCSSEMSVGRSADFQRITWKRVPGNATLHNHWCENLNFLCYFLFNLHEFNTSNDWFASDSDKEIIVYGCIITFWDSIYSFLLCLLLRTCFLPSYFRLYSRNFFHWSFPLPVSLSVTFSMHVSSFYLFLEYLLYSLF